MDIKKILNIFKAQKWTDIDLSPKNAIDFKSVMAEDINYYRVYININKFLKDDEILWHGTDPPIPITIEQLEKFIKFKEYL